MSEPLPLDALAKLARLSLASDERATLAADLARVVGLLDALAAVDVSGAEPLAHPNEPALALRADVVTETDRHAEFLARAPEAQGGFFLVPKVIE